MDSKEAKPKAVLTEEAFERLNELENAINEAIDYFLDEGGTLEEIRRWYGNGSVLELVKERIEMREWVNEALRKKEQ